MAETKGRLQQTSTVYSEPYWFVEIWQNLRPYVVKLLADFAIFVLIWMLLLAAHALTEWLPLGTMLSPFLITFHGFFALATFVWLSLLATWEMMLLKKKGARHGLRHQSNRP